MSTVQKSIRLYAWKTNYQTFRIVQGEVDSRTFNIQLFSTTIPVNLSKCSVMLYAVKPDSNVVYTECDVLDATNGLVSVTLDEQIAAVEGTVDCWIQVIGEGGTDLRFEGMNIQVGECDITRSIESSSEFKAFLQQSAKVGELEQEVKAARMGSATLADKERAQDNALAGATSTLRAEFQSEDADIREELAHGDTVLQQNIDAEKARIDQLAASPEIGEGDLEKEMGDLRVGDDGVTYGSAGTAVRKRMAVRNVKAEKMTDMPEIQLPVQEVQQAIEQKGQEVLNSIPEEYTDLSEEVTGIRTGADGEVYESAGEAVRTQFTNLKSDLVQLEVLNLKELYNSDKAVLGVRIKADGTDYSDSTFFVSDYIEIEPNTVYSFNFNFSDVIRACTYSADKTTKTVYQIGNFVKTESDAKYIRFCNKLDTKDTCKIEVLNIVDYTKQNTADIRNAKNGYETFVSYCNIARGSYTNGVVDSRTNRVVSAETLKFDRDITLRIESGFLIRLDKYENGVFSNDLGWKENSYVIPKNTEFKFVIARENEDMTEVAEIEVFANSVTFATSQETRLTMLETASALPKDNIDSLLYRNILPTYYFDSVKDNSFATNEYLEECISRVPYGKSFIFLTDSHYPRNSHESSKVINYVRGRLGIKTVVNGGDFIDQYSSKYDALKELRKAINEQDSAFGRNGLYAMGNHDNNTANWATEEELRNAEIPYEYIQPLIANEQKGIVCYDATEKLSSYTLTDADKEELLHYFKLNYYYDEVESGTRYVVINTGNPNGVQRRFFDLHNMGEVRLIVYWLYDVLLSVPTGYNVVLCGHQFDSMANPPTLDYTEHIVLKMLSALKAKTSTSFSKSSNGNANYDSWLENKTHTFDFSSANDIGHIVAVSGHVHANEVFISKLAYNDSYIHDGATAISQTSGDLPVIVTQSDAYNGDPDVSKTYYEMEKGTTTEICFDIVTMNNSGIYLTRVGAGADRKIPFN